MNIKNLATNTITICILILLFLLAFTWIIFDFNKSSNSLKDTFSIVSSMFGGIATLAAAYIGSRLFNDWKIEVEFNRSKELHDEAVTVIIESMKKMGALITLLNEQIQISNNENISAQEKNNEFLTIAAAIKNNIVDIQSITHNMSVKFGLDYLQSINKQDEKLKFVFGFIIELKEKIQKLASDQGFNPVNAPHFVDFHNQMVSKLDSYLNIVVKNYNHSEYDRILKII